MTGGFNADYGGRISAVVDLKTREGDKKRFGGVVGANPFQANVLLEGPIVPLNVETGTSVSFLVTGKHSYIDQTSPNLYPYINENDSIALPFSFTDLYGKISLVSGNGSKVDVFGFNFQDEVDFPDLATLDWTTQGAGLRFSLIPNNSAAIMEGNFSYSDYELSLIHI